MILEEITLAFQYKNLRAGSGGRLVSAAAPPLKQCCHHLLLLFKTPPPPLSYHRHFLLPAGLSVDINSVHSLQSHNNPFPSVHFQDHFTPKNYDGLFPSAVSFYLAVSLLPPILCIYSSV